MKHLSRRLFLRAVLVLASALSVTSILSAAPGPLDKAYSLQKRVTGQLMKEPGVLGTAIGLDANGAVALVIYVDVAHPNAGNVKAPLGCTIQLTDKFRAMGKPGGGSAGGKPGGGGGTAVSHTAIQTPPILLGTSGGWSKDLANGYCCGGTFGSLVQVGTKQYILSNYHVMEADIVSGGNGTTATSGDPVIQPGLIDVNCDGTKAQAVGSLVKLSSIPSSTSNVDVGLALVNPGMVSADGAILEIGTISSTTVAASLNQAVKKSGRTTGLSRSTIVGLNATISVAYDNECAGGQAFTQTYTGQIVIGNKGSKFLNSGDSGSLMVEDVATNPRAVGLLYAGSSTSAIANPIGDVLAFITGALGGGVDTATMVGVSPAP